MYLILNEDRQFRLTFSALATVILPLFGMLYVVTEYPKFTLPLPCIIAFFSSLAIACSVMLIADRKACLAYSEEDKKAARVQERILWTILIACIIVVHDIMALSAFLIWG